VQDIFRDVNTVGREFHFVRRGAAANLHTVRFALGALEVADKKGHQVGGHLGGGEKLQRVFSFDGPVYR